MNIPTIDNLSGDIACRVPEWTRDGRSNVADQVRQMIAPLYAALAENERCEDCRRYRVLLGIIKTLTGEGQAEAWAELEQIKNRHHGRPPL